MSKPLVKKVLLSKIVFDGDVYPRKEHDPKLVQQYANDIEEIETTGHYMSVASDMTLLDGKHRHLAYLKRNNGKEVKVPVLVYQVKADADKFAVAVKLNSTHGKQLSMEDKRRSVLKLYAEHQFPIEQIAKLASVRKATALEWTKTVRKEEEHQMNESIFDMWLACYTAGEIGERLEIGEQTVRDRLKELCTEKFLGTKPWKLSDFTDFEEEDLLRPIYNVWRYGKNSNKVSYFGDTDPRIMDRLLYLYTDPFDIVVDCFGGSGVTIDVCKNRLRRYWVSDRKPIVERANEIRELDITKGLPPLNKRWADVRLSFLDPPYWKQAEGKYSKDPEDLGNMSLEDFNKTLAEVINGIADKQSKGVIALLIQPTQWKAANREFTDHVFDMARMANPKKLKLINRVSCPLSSEQCTPPMVEWAKENRELLVISRELVVWRII